MMDTERIAVVREKYHALSGVMNERVRRRWAATEAKALGWGGISTVAQATGLSRTTVRAGLVELDAEVQRQPEAGEQRIRRRLRTAGPSGLPG